MRQGISLEYIAGFFDGEGSVGIYTNGRGTYHLRTQLVQNRGASDPLFRELQERYGGARSGCKTKRAANWQLSADKAATFLRDILPFLILKHEQAEVAIAWQEQRLPPRRDARGRILGNANTPYDREMANRLKELKKL